MERCLFPTSVGISALMFIHKSIFPFLTVTLRVIKFVSRQGNGVNRRNESTKLEFFCTDDISSHLFVFDDAFLTSFLVDL